MERHELAYMFMHDNNSDDNDDDDVDHDIDVNDYNAWQWDSSLLKEYINRWAAFTLGRLSVLLATCVSLDTATREREWEREKERETATACCQGS